MYDITIASTWMQRIKKTERKKDGTPPINFHLKVRVKKNEEHIYEHVCIQVLKLLTSSTIDCDTAFEWKLECRWCRLVCTEFGNGEGDLKEDNVRSIALAYVSAIGNGQFVLTLVVWWFTDKCAMMFYSYRKSI